MVIQLVSTRLIKLNFCIQSVLFLFIFMCVSAVLCFHGHALSYKSNPCMQSAKKNIGRHKWSLIIASGHILSVGKIIQDR